MVFIGGTDTYGKYVQAPYPDLVEQKIGMPCLNLGTLNAGVDVFLAEPEVIALCKDAQTVVVQTMGAHNMSNRFYSVHPRRNDRFIKASELLKSVYRDVDFTEYAFTRHLLVALREASEDRFKVIETELKVAWLSRMELLLSKVPGKKVLLHISSQASEQNEPQMFGPDPLFVDDDMVECLRSVVDELVKIRVPNALMRKTDGMTFPVFEEPAAMQIIGPGVHKMIYEKLESVL